LLSGIVDNEPVVVGYNIADDGGKKYRKRDPYTLYALCVLTARVFSVTIEAGLAAVRARSPPLLSDTASRFVKTRVGE
jgi:hypothetical protein